MFKLMIQNTLYLVELEKGCRIFEHQCIKLPFSMSISKITCLKYNSAALWSSAESWTPGIFELITLLYLLTNVPFWFTLTSLIRVNSRHLRWAKQVQINPPPHQYQKADRQSWRQVSWAFNSQRAKCFAQELMESTHLGKRKRVSVQAS